MKFIFVSFFCPDASVLRSTTTDLRWVKRRKGWGFSTGSFKRSQLTIKLHFLLQYHPHGLSLWTTHSSLVFYIYTELLSVKRKILHELKVFLQNHKPHKYLRLAVAPKHSHRFCRFTFQWNWVLDPGFVALGSSIKSLFLLVSQVQLKINNNRLKRKISELNQLFLHLRGICPPNIRRAQTERDEVITASYTCSSDLIKHESMHSAHMSLQCLQKHSPLQQNFQRLQPELHN